MTCRWADINFHMPYQSEQLTMKKLLCLLTVISDINFVTSLSANSKQFLLTVDTILTQIENLFTWRVI